MIHRSILIVVLSVLQVFSGPSASGDGHQGLGSGFDPEHTLWADLLERAVHTNPSKFASKVDYQIFLDESKMFNRYLRSLSAISEAQFSGFSQPEQLAFLLNAYNAFMVAKVLRRYPEITSVWDFGRVLSSPFKDRFIELLGERRSLDDIEHRLIRGNPRLMDPRIHFAVNCASVGCPALRQEPYLAPQIEAQLEDQTRRFLSDRSRNYFNQKSGRLQVSPLFDWYEADFEPPERQAQEGVVGFLLYYATALGLSSEAQAQLAQGQVKLGYTTYDWDLNALRQASVLSEGQ